MPDARSTPSSTRSRMRCGAAARSRSRDSASLESPSAPPAKASTHALANARERGLLGIADGKRGDIEITARAYAHALSGELETPFGGVPGLRADLVTVNPLLGGDGVEPFVSVARAAGRGVLVLVRTSNRGAADIQDLGLLDGGAVRERIARLVA